MNYHDSKLNVLLLVDGHWLTWGPWGHCAVSCGGGVQLRDRKCFGTKYGGVECLGEDGEEQTCNDHLCPGMRGIYSFNSTDRKYIP